MSASPTTPDPTLDKAALEKRVAELEAALAERDTKLAERDAKLAEREAAVAQLSAECERIKHEYDKLARRLFGRTAEKVDPRQLALAFADEAPPEAPTPPHVGEAPDGETAPPPAPEGKGRAGKKGHGRRPLPATLSRRREEIHPPADQLQCACGQHKIVIGEEKHELLERVPASFVVIERARLKYACPKGCEAAVVCAPPPPAPIEKGLAGPGTLAWVVTSKYADHLPLNRISGIMTREGIDLSISTLCGWVSETAGLLRGIVHRVREQVLASPVVQLDETGVKVIDKKAREGVRKGRMWAYRGAAGDVLFVHSATKANDDPEGPAVILEGYRGYGQADAYGGFDQLFASGNIVEVGCWAHTRRKFFDAKDSSPREAAWALLTIKRLYELEAEAKERSFDPEKRCALRREMSKPIVDDFFSWLAQLCPVPKTPLAQAVTYARNQEQALRRFLEDGRLETDNNACERALRAVAVGRKNWLFAGSADAARNAAGLYSLVVGCKEIGVDPLEYLRDVIERVSTHPASRVDELTPVGWAAVRRARAPTT